jgi:aldose 1-epimerase
MQSTRVITLCLSLITGGAGMANAGTVTSTPFGTTWDGKPVSLYTLGNNHGVTVKFISYGGIITEIDTPDRHGHPANIVLGFRTLHEYETAGATIYFGALIGRYANRIGHAQFDLDGQHYQLFANDHGNTQTPPPPRCITTARTARKDFRERST